MKVIISYVSFYWDNYQGGSGKSFELSMSLDIPDNMTACNIWEYIHERLLLKVKNERPFQQHEKYSIQKVEIV